MKRILTITSNDLGISWGPAIHYLELWNEFCEISPHAVTGCAPSWTKTKPIIHNKFQLRTLSVLNIPSVRQMIFDARMAVHLLAHRRRYDLIYLRLSHWHPLQTIALKLIDTPFALELNGLAKDDAASAGRNGLLSHMISLQEAWLARNATLCIAVSDGIAHAILSKYHLRGNVVTIGNGVAKQFFAARRGRHNAAAPLTIIYVGTFTSWDGAAEVAKLACKFPDIDFMMVGDGTSRVHIQQHAPRNVRFVGKVDYAELPALYRQADAAIVLYEYERHRNVKVSSLKTLEYVASRLPVFTTDIPGQEYIREHGYGVLVKEHTNMEDVFADFIANLDHYASNYTQSTDDMYGSFGWKRTARETAAALQKLVS
ncbi:glycosyltransferase [Allopusillimonas ginsengisoli]|uniref:glycosyltransferase n=1 Tax=Allopusillimonas ginsengisoli TaxID=453575 RepID=UPI0010209D94|nr:glycosyltransferase [Allopusillimonas ginsengisoli]TEA78619.1 glycosyltransferase [Allopusillimonas ginsengisoli]